MFDANGYEMFTENATITQVSLKEAAENLSRSLTQERVSCAINTVPTRKYAVAKKIFEL